MISTRRHLGARHCLAGRAVAFADAAEVGAIDQVGDSILAERDCELGRCGSGYVDQDRVGTAEVGVGVVESLPIRRCEVVGRLRAEDRTWLSLRTASP